MQGEEFHLGVRHFGAGKRLGGEEGRRGSWLLLVLGGRGGCSRGVCGKRKGGEGGGRGAAAAAVLRLFTGRVRPLEWTVPVSNFWGRKRKRAVEAQLP